MTRTLEYRLHELVPYINWIYFFHSWGMPPRFASTADVHDCPACRETWMATFNPADRPQAREAARLYRDATTMLAELDGTYKAYARFALYPAASDGDDILVYEAEKKDGKSGKPDGAKTTRLPFLRQQQPRPGAPCLCLADFISPGGPASADKFPVAGTLGIFASAVDERMERLHAGDGYARMLVQTLCDRLAEAAAEKMHEAIRREFWGYAPEERLTPRELFAEKYQGRRPAVGYPSLPDQSFIFLMDDLLDFGQIGIRLTENGMMMPHAAVAGLLFGHPATRHFSVGPIDREQLADYARRRGLDEAVVAKFLAGNLRD